MATIAQVRLLLYSMGNGMETREIFLFRVFVTLFCLFGVNKHYSCLPLSEELYQYYTHTIPYHTIPYHTLMNVRVLKQTNVTPTPFVQTQKDPTFVAV